MVGVAVGDVGAAVGVSVGVFVGAVVATHVAVSDIVPFTHLVAPDTVNPSLHVGWHCQPLSSVAPSVAHAESDAYAPFEGAAGAVHEDEEAVSASLSKERPLSA